jgi:N-acetylmuramoyl-L-alanine amidase
VQNSADENLFTSCQTMFIQIAKLYLHAVAPKVLRQVGALKRISGLVVLGAAMSGCATTDLVIDKSYSAVGQDSRIRFVIIHFTYGDSTSSLKTLTEGPVSSHYWVDINPPKVLQLVPEDKRAYHAGISQWKGVTALNASSIGIEIVNAGPRPNASGELVYTDYPKNQIDVVVQLVRQITQRHGITPDRVLGHSDIAPSRKTDPGPKFPWKRLAEEGLAVWPDEKKVDAVIAKYQTTLPDITWFQNKLKLFGYAPPLSGQFDQETKDVLVAFQMRFRPNNFSGQPDAQSAAILEVLTENMK